MKKFWFFFLFMILVASPAWATIWYVDGTSGIDQAGCGAASGASACATMGRLIDTEQTVTNGDTVSLAVGTITEDSAVAIPVGVDVTGQGDTTILKGSGVFDILLLDRSASPSSTAQTLSSFKLDGENTIRRGLRAQDQSNLTLHHITITNFDWTGIVVKGAAADSEAGSGNYITGVEIYNIVSTNASSDPGWGTGAIEIGGSTGAIIRDCTLTETDANARVGIKYGGDYGHNKGILIYDNAIDVGENDDGQTFTIELWEVREDSKIYSNTFTGHLNIDETSKGAGTYGVEIYDNLFKLDGSATSSDASGMSLDDNCADVRIYRNHFENFYNAISFYLAGAVTQENIDIFSNTFYNNLHGSSGVGPVIYALGTGSGTMSNVNIYNNFFELNATYNNFAINITTNTQSGTINIKNNVIINAETAPAACYEGGGGNATWDIQYNFYNNNAGNAFANNCSAGSVTDSNHVTASGAPDIVGSGNRPDPWYRPDDGGSNLVDVGVDVGLSYSGSAPDIGRYEYERRIMIITGD